MARIIRKMNPALPQPPRLLNAAAYARVSMDKDSMLHSLSAQVSYYSDLIQKNPGWHYVGVYADKALTGTKAERPEFQQLLADCRAGKIDMVITKSISRFARNTVTLLATVRELRALGVDVYFEEQNIHSMSGDGELMLTILASYAQEESRSVSENCKWRIHKSYEAGKSATWRFLYGYSIRKGKTVIHPLEADIVRQVFDSYLHGVASANIAASLCERGVLGYRGGTWTPNRVVKLLKNEKYAGNALLQKKFTVDFLSKRTKVNEGEVPQYYVEGSHPAIITPELFDAVQAELKRRKEPGRRNYTPHCFSGRIYCDECGALYGKGMERQ